MNVAVMNVTICVAVLRNACRIVLPARIEIVREGKYRGIFKKRDLTKEIAFVIITQRLDD